MVGGSKKDAAVCDERFAHIATDPKFRTLKRSAQRVKADARWRGMIKDERFTLKASAVDKRGRPKHTSLKEDLLRVYDISESDSEEDDKEDSSADDGSSDKNDESLVANAAELKKTWPDESVASELLPDIARGEGLQESSSEDEDEVYIGRDTANSNDDIEHAWGEMDRDAGETSTVTSRLAVCNMDWDRIRAVDLLVLFNSFKPERGVIQSVSIYPSEYGLQKMQEEKEEGPIELKDLPLNQDDDEDVICDDGKDFHREKLRQYQLSRLRFYYAVVTCDSPETASEIYDKCDGIEYECSANKLDLRFVPDDMTFEHKPKSTATSLPDGASYQPSIFANSALQCSTVTLTWDETPHERKSFMEQNFSKDDLEEQDLRDYIASDTDSGEDPYGDLIDDSQWRQKPVANNENDDDDDDDDDASRIEKFKELVRSLKDEKEHRDEKHIQMEVTWEPGLRDKTEKKIKEQERQNKKLTPWEEFKEKKKKKRLEKKEARLKRTHPEDEDDENEEEEMPAGVDLSDPYFAEELAKLPPKDSGKEGKKNGKKLKKKMKKVKLSVEEMEDAKRQEAELALLVMDNGDGKKHFDLSERKKKKKKKAKLGKSDKTKNDSEKSEVVMDVTDPRFKAIYDNPLYNVDPSAPEFKRSKTMEAILDEKVKRRTKQRSSD